MPNLTQILKLLDLSDEKDIYGVIGRMEVLQDFFAADPQHIHLVPFLRTYWLVTKRVVDNSIANQSYYEDYSQVQKLDIHFASLYFNAVSQFLQTGAAPQPWREYFKYCQKSEGNNFLRMLLGINSHINGDLAHSLYEVDYKSESDFNKVNEVLLQVIPVVMTELAFHEHDLLGAGAVVFKQFTEMEFNKIIVTWRAQAWKNYLQMKSAGNTDNLKKIHPATESVAIQLIQLFDWKQIIHINKWITDLDSLYSQLVFEVSSPSTYSGISRLKMLSWPLTGKIGWIKRKLRRSQA